MDKSLEIKKHTMILFFINLVVLFTMILFKVYFSSAGYHAVLVNVMLVINVVVLLAGIVFNVIFIKKPNDFAEDRMIKTIVACFVIYLIINTLGVFLINKPLDAGYTKISTTLSDYCRVFGCDRYETVKDGSYEDFVIRKTYFDYNNVENEMEVHTKYSSKSVASVSATIYSESNLFSETIINDQLKNYFFNFKYNISEVKIREAFDNRFKGFISDGKATYRVTEIYEGEQLRKLKTQITLDLKQD